MHILILAAGYATRLYPLTKDTPKPLLPVAGKPMIEHVLDNLAPIEGIEGVLIVTNQKFAGHFEDWAKDYRARGSAFDFKIINDGSTSDEDKLGAIGDIHYVIEREKVGDLLVVAGDNLFSQSLEGFGDYARRRGEAVLALYDVGDLEAIKKYNNITVDAEGRITEFEEKPANPKSTLTGIALYYYPARIVELLHTYIAEGNNPDQPGRFVQWLYTREPVYTWQVPGLWFDIGSKETLEEADKIFRDL